MAQIQTAIELQDNFTGVLYQVIDSVNLGLAAMEHLHQTMNAPVETASVDAARDSINQAAAAVQRLDEAMQGLDAPAIEMPTAAQTAAPVTLPVQWRTGGLEVFDGSGMERFEQEARSANEMLGILNQSQRRIMETAERTDLFPADAVSDMNQMQNRLQAIQQRIHMMESNALDMGADAANAELERLRGQLQQAIQEQQSLNRAVENLDVQAANNAYLRLSQTISGTERNIRDNVDEQGRFNREIGEGTQEANRLMQTIGRAIATYATIQTLSAGLNLSDQLTSMTARLNLMNDGMQTTQELQDMIYASAERSRGSYLATANSVSKLGLMAGDAFGSSEEIVAFMEQINKHFAIAGTEASGIDAAMLQLTQAMGSGVLRGEEFNSIMEQAPNIMQAIADYMEVPKGQLKDMAAEGQITSDVVKAAMFAAADETNAKFETMPETFSQIWTSFKNAALREFQPVFEKMSEIANSEAFQEFVNNAIGALSMVAGVVLEIFDFLVGVASVAADNWSWLSPIIYGVAGALMVYYGWLVLTKIATGMLTIAKMLAVPVYAALTGATMADTAAQMGLNTALYACPLVWIIILIIALIALFYAAVEVVNKFAGTSTSATGLICGAFMFALASIGNVFVTLWNLVVDVFSVIYNLVAKVANFIGNVFDDPVGAVCRLFFDLADTVLEILQTLASAIDTIFGSDLSGAVQGWRDTLGSWVDDTFGKGKEVMEEMDPSSMHLERFDNKKAWDAGNEFGQGIDDKLSDLFSGDESKEEKQNRGEKDNNNYSVYGGGGGGGASGLGAIGSGVDDIAGNTEVMADAVDIAKEDLKYLRDIAEREYVNRFTTAEIRVDMTNHNNISSNMDLDGITNRLKEKMEEEMASAAEGVHK